MEALSITKSSCTSSSAETRRGSHLAKPFFPFLQEQKNDIGKDVTCITTAISMHTYTTRRLSNNLRPVVSGYAAPIQCLWRNYPPEAALIDSRAWA